MEWNLKETNLLKIYKSNKFILKSLNIVIFNKYIMNYFKYPKLILIIDEF